MFVEWLILQNHTPRGHVEHKPVPGAIDANAVANVVYNATEDI
jgi:hypothetical protein